MAERHGVGPKQMPVPKNESKILEFPRNPKISPEEQKDAEREVLKINNKILNLHEESTILIQAIIHIGEEEEGPRTEATQARIDHLWEANQDILDELVKLRNELKKLESHLGPEVMAEVEKMYAEIRLIKKETGHYGFSDEKGAEKRATEKPGSFELYRKVETQIAEAREIMGKDFFGPAEVLETFGGPQTEYLSVVPEIPFSLTELHRAKELDQFLILRVNKAPDGKPLTMKKMDELLKPELKKAGGRVLSTDGSGWYKDEEFFTTDTPKLGWALVSKKAIPNSIDQNYLKQTLEVVRYLTFTVFKSDKLMPPQYQKAVVEFNKYYYNHFLGKTDEQIQEMLGDVDRKKYAQELASLKINQLCRQTPVEVLYDILVSTQKTNILPEWKFSFTKSLTSDGEFVSLGWFDTRGMNIHCWGPAVTDGLDVVFSRTS